MAARSGRSGRAAPDRVDRALDSRRLHLRAARDRPRLRRRAHLDAVLTAAGHRCVGQRLLGPDPVHAADVADHHHRPRAGDIGADGHGDSRASPAGRARRAARWRWSRSSRWSTSWFNWGFSLIFSAVLAREVARRVEGVDYRALAAASLLGIGSIWAQGLSGSAALQMATPGALQPQIRDIVAAGGIVPGGMIPFRDTIFLWQSLVSVAGRDRRRRAGDVAGDAAGRESEDRGDARRRSRHERASRRRRNPRARFRRAPGSSIRRC